MVRFLGKIGQIVSQILKNVSQILTISTLDRGGSAEFQLNPSGWSWSEIVGLWSKLVGIIRGIGWKWLDFWRKSSLGGL